MRGNESQEINSTLSSMAAFWLFPQTGVLSLGPCCWKKTVSVTDLSQNVEITSRKRFSDNNGEQATLFLCCKSSLWKARRPVLTTPQHTLASWTAGEIKAGGVLSVPKVARRPVPTEGPAGCCTDTILWAARSQWAWALCLVQTGCRAWTQWVCQEEAPRWLSAERTPAEGGDYLCTKRYAERRASVDEVVSSLLRTHAQPWGCSWGWLLHLLDP